MSIPSPKRHRRTAACAAAVVALLIPAAASADTAHVHGVAELRVVVDGARLDVALESPLENLLGFEHAPHSEAERNAVRALALRLRQPQTLFAPDAAAQCAVSKVEIEAPSLPAELLDNPKPAANAPAVTTGDHADLAASFRWRCAGPGALKGIEVALLQVFPGLRTVKVQIVGPRGQSAAVLSGAQRSLRW